MARRGIQSTLLALSCIAFGAAPCQAAEAAGRPLECERLRTLLAENPDLPKALQNGLDHQLASGCIRCNDGNASYWHGKSLDQFVAFFCEWQQKVPPADTDSIGVENLWFADYVTVPEGYLAVQTPLFRSWMIDFIEARKEFLESPASAANVEQLPESWFEDFVVPEGGFRSWVDFFTRQLRPGTRPFAHPDDPCVLDSPVDGSFVPASSIVTLPADLDYQTLVAKGDVLSVREVFNNHPFAARFLEGTVLTFWLEFSNAHWFYVPLDGTVVAAEVLAGLYGFEYAWQNLPAHKRGYVLLDTEKFGLVGVLVVGLQAVSEIDFAIGAGDAVQKGDLMGHFDYGGSTAMVFFEKDKAAFSPAFLRELADQPKEPHTNPINVTVPVRIGQELLRASGCS